jgi:O-acetyl-ADP-ribose deacetylase (regulator of RNase III)
MFVFDTGVFGPRRYIVNFPTKQRWRDASRIEDIGSGLAALTAALTERSITSVAVPALGCGLGGLVWTDVHALIEESFDRASGIRAFIYAPVADKGQA